MRRMLAVIRFDLVNALRDSMVLYILAAPIILALALGFIVGAVEGAGASFAVDVSDPAGARLATSLAVYGRVEALPSRDAVEARVRQADTVAGIIIGASGPEVLLHGNEGPEAAALVTAVLTSIGDGEAASYRMLDRPGARSAFRDYARICLAMLAMLIGGVAAAFSLVEEKECKATRAFAVSPLSTGEYFAARGLWAAGVGLAGAVVAHLIMGSGGMPFWRFAAAAGASLFMPLSICLLIGGLASNQIQAVASLKIVMLVYLALPFGSLLVPEAWTFLFWPLPNWWMFQAFRGAYIPGQDGFILAVAITAASGLALAWGLGVILGNRLSPGRFSRRNVVQGSGRIASGASSRK